MTAQGLTLRGLLRLLSGLPLPVVLWLGTVLGQLMYWLPNRNLRLARRNIELCFPATDPARRQRLVRDSLRSMGQSMLELGWFWRRSPRRVLARIAVIHGQDLFEQACQSGRGVLLAAPHLGSWELICQYLPGQIKSTIMYKRPRDNGIEQVIVAARRRTGANLIAADGRGVRQAFKALRRGELVGILPDQQPKTGQGQFAPFFGVEALTMVLVSKLVQKTACEVVFAWAERRPGGVYDFHFSAADPAIADPDIAVSVAALNRGVERCVRQCPTQYQWGYKRFGIRPEGQPPLY